MSTRATTRTIRVFYFAILREKAGCGEEQVTTSAESARDLFQELAARYEFGIEVDRLKVVINEVFSDWSSPLSDGDTIAFVPPVAGGTDEGPAAGPGRAC